ncbi:MAG: hypothetical protein M1829_003680 [Trizodia sp. TS-e1964]|nr:MAG: hypothetical protein M1829_003680 [Trizodia sp. TS-e1964]
MTREVLPAYSPVEAVPPPFDEAAPPAFDEAQADNQSTRPLSETSRFMTAEEEKSQLALSINGEHESITDQSSIVRTPASSIVDGLEHVALSRGLQVPTKTRLVSSGFPYPESLQLHNITADDWARFTSEITGAAKMKLADWAVTIAGGLGVGAASGPLLHGFALIPALIVGHQVRRIREVRNLKIAMTPANGKVDLESSLLRWNEDFFAPRGVLVRLDLPGESTRDITQMDLARVKRNGCSGQHFRRARKSAAAPEKMLWRDQKQAMRKGRVVIIPLNKQPHLSPAERGVTEVIAVKSEV